MGLGFNNSTASWSYSGFHNFRKRLALEIDVRLDDMIGFKSGDDGISWDTVKDPIKLLLNHSDCDGELTSEECGIIAPRLRELVSKWPDDDYDKEAALKLAEGMEECKELDWTLRFQ